MDFTKDYYEKITIFFLSRFSPILLVLINSRPPKKPSKASREHNNNINSRVDCLWCVSARARVWKEKIIKNKYYTFAAGSVTG